MIRFIPKKQKGFTLVELIIVILIIGILTSIAVPLYFDMTEGSKISALLSNHSTYVYAAKLYIINNKELPTTKEELSTYISTVNYDFDGNPTGSTYKIEGTKIIARLPIKNSSEPFEVEYDMTK